ncbi:MAG: hypothetical protein ACTSRG_14200 [Candidatus Helarchaeota archaeon]
MTLNPLTLPLLIIWAIVFVVYIFIPVVRFGEMRVKLGIFLMLLSIAVQTIVYVEKSLHFSSLYLFASGLIIFPSILGYLICLDSHIEYKVTILFVINNDVFFISLVLFYLPFHPVIFNLLLFWIIIFTIYILLVIPLVKSIDFRKKFGILLFMIAISIFSFGFIAPLVHHLKNCFITTNISFVAFNIDINNGIVFLKIFNDLVFFIVSWMAIFTFSILSFLPDASYQDSKKLVLIMKGTILFFFNLFLVSLIIFWVFNLFIIIIILGILFFIDIIYPIRICKQNK